MANSDNKAFDMMIDATSDTVIGDIINKISETYISKDERLTNFDKWYDRYGQGRDSRRGIPRHKRRKDYLALKAVWEESGSPLISTEAYTEEYGKKFPGRAHAVNKPFYYGRTGFGRDTIYNIRNYEDLFAELAHTYKDKNKGIIGRFIDKKRTRFEHDDPTRKREKEGDFGMYDKKTIDFPEWTEKLGLKDVWSLESQAHGVGPQYKEEGGIGRQKILYKQYKDLYSRPLEDLEKSYG